MGPAFRRLLPFVIRYKRQFSIGLFYVFLTTAIQLLPPWVMKHAVDDLTTGVTRGKLATYASILMAIALAGAVTRYYMRLILIGASRDVEYDIRTAFSPASCSCRSATTRPAEPGI